jgi:hypothetical protein
MPGDAAVTSSRAPEPAPAPTPAEVAAVASRVAPSPAPSESLLEIEVAFLPASGAQALAWYLDSSPRSPLAARPGLEAYATAPDKDGIAGLRVRGFAEKDEDFLAKLRATPNPLSGGPLGGARWVEPPAR